MTPAADRAQQAYFDAVAQHIDNGERWEIVARAVIEAYKEQTRQVETDITVSVDEMRKRREQRGWEIYGCAIPPETALMNAYEEMLDGVNYLEAARHWKRHSAKAIAEELLDDLREAAE